MPLRPDIEREMLTFSRDLDRPMKWAYRIEYEVYPGGSRHEVTDIFEHGEAIDRAKELLLEESRVGSYATVYATPYDDERGPSVGDWYPWRTFIRTANGARRLVAYEKGHLVAPELHRQIQDDRRHYGSLAHPL